jgi:hypothetical protein
MGDMDNEQAKLILQAYRPGGEDADDPFFSEALDQARIDPEFAKWFAEQRTFDEAMRKALQTRIPPIGLRDSILLTKKISTLPRRPVWRRPGVMALAASIVVLLAAALLIRPGAKHYVPMTVAAFTQQVLDMKDRISLGKLSNNPGELRAWLAERGAPSDFELPPGLRDAHGLGCQSYTIGGAKVSLMCFMLGEDQFAHLFIVERDALKDAAPSASPVVRDEDGTPVATWTSSGKGYVLIGINVNEETLRRLFAHLQHGDQSPSMGKQV